MIKKESRAIACLPVTKGLSIALLSTLPALLLSTGPAIASECQQATSLIQTADGRCFDLGYLTVLGRSRQNLQNASNLYQQAIQTNPPGPSASLTSTAVTRNSTTSVMTVDIYNPTAEERKESREIIRHTSEYLQQRAITNEDIERWAFRKQQRVLNGVSGTFSNPSPVYHYPVQVCLEVCSW
ncbi:hypothetical protein J5X98_23140 [Leptothermofonsia sichuanensis E412]|uniref:hypothetical protein n=1 Tax=Leptothermofonsia sichuanensis TaxID=2917832 RepID=UPI001CA66D11|nr:hypothetical protein [Leptothermofonsia sichuanensis]QZZ20138.1 hypothetical protein J5X98_23140 [Leptothermofonsia sichuanensis E412]